MKKPLLLLSTLIISSFGSIAISQTDTTANIIEDDFFDLSLEDLLNMDVTSVSKKAERLQDVASSIYVLTSADILNSGATTLHEALRSVPGYWGIQTDYSNVAPDIRNSPSFSGNGTVLFLLDGTPIQDNMSSSFAFNNFDIPMDEIDRIEVIRGSGGTVYGANSATGVVNIFTKNPEKYDGAHVKVDGAGPGLMAATIRAGGKINEKISISGYAKVRSFKGYGTLYEMQGDNLYVPKADTILTTGVIGDSVNIKNRFTEDFETTKMYSGGFKVAYKMGKKSKLSLNTHMNMSQKTEYTNFDTDNVLLPLVAPGAPYSDSLVVTDATRSRIVGNVRFDHDFSDNHSLFVRASTNIEDDFIKLFGGYQVSNSIYDFEIQDNLSLGKFNDLSIGANYRMVNFEINEINDPEGVVFIEPKNTESLNGFFIQDKVKLFDGKLNFLLGIKAETYSLVNDDYYLSPMAKVSIIPFENLTIWGGYTQSYTTPGYNTTNIDLLILRTLSDETISGLAYQGVYDAVYDPTYAGNIAGGATPAQAAAAATAAAESFVASPTGLATITGTEQAIRNGAPNNTGVINGSETKPTKYQTWEVGFRSNIENTLSLESNFYYTTISDGVRPSSNTITTNSASLHNEGVFADYYAYGNYIKGTIYGVESTIRIIPAKGTKIEVSHVFTKSAWEFQENPDFDINDPSVVSPSDIDQSPTTSIMPEHVFRMKGFFELPKNFSYNLEFLYATTFNSQSNYEYDLQRYPNIISQGGIIVGRNNSRTIVNMSVHKIILDDKLKISLFGNDIFNSGIIANSTAYGNVTLSQIRAMYGASIAYKF
jgi:outer membrane receptor for ferrienterochelin and colicin